MKHSAIAATLCPLVASAAVSGQAIAAASRHATQIVYPPGRRSPSRALTACLPKMFRSTCCSPATRQLNTPGSMSLFSPVPAPHGIYPLPDNT